MTKKEAKIILNAAKYLRKAAEELERLEAPVTRNAAIDELDGDATLMKLEDDAGCLESLVRTWFPDLI